MDVQTTGGFLVTRSMVISYVVITLLFVFWCYYKWSRRAFNRLAAKLKGPPSYPIIGTGLQGLGTSQQVMENMMKIGEKYGSEPFKIWMGTSFAVVISKPEDLQIILNSPKALERSSFYKFMKNLLGEGILTAPVDKWRVHRRMINPVFNVNLMKDFFPVFNEKNEILIKNLRKEVGRTQPFDLMDYIAPTVLDTICQTMMGYNLKTQSNNVSEFATNVKKALELDVMRIYKPWLYPDILFSFYRKLTGSDQIYEIAHKLPNQVIKEMKEVHAQKQLTNHANAMNDSIDVGRKKHLKAFMSTLLELRDAGVNLSDDDIKDEVVTMMIADKVYDELYEVLGDNDETITIDETYKLVYLEQVIRETLRLFPPGPVIIRQLQDDVKIISGNHVLPKGTNCIISPLGTHCIAGKYPNPLSFNPDNFKPENVIKRHKYSFLAFSGGPRACIGSKYAMLSMKVLLSTLLRNFSVHTDTKLSDIKLGIDLLMRSVHGYPVTIRPRDRRPTCNQN